MKNSQSTNKEKKSFDVSYTPKGSLYANDLDNSFFSYLNDLKKFELNPGGDRTLLIWHIDNTMTTFQEQLFAFAPAVQEFIQILNDIVNNEKVTPDDIFFTSSIRDTPESKNNKYFEDLQNSLLILLNNLQNTSDPEKQNKIRCETVKKCCVLKINHDCLNSFFNIICSYTGSHEQNNILPDNITPEIRKSLAEKFLLPENTVELHLKALKHTVSQLTMMKHEILKDHLRLVISIAHKFRNRGVPFNDIIQEGNLGLMRAIDKFDPHLGHKFSTYAVWWIKQNMLHAVAAQSRTIRIPTHMLSLINKINSAEQKLLQILGREPESEEIAGYLNLTSAKVNAIRCMARQAISLQAPVSSKDETFSLEDTLNDNRTSGDFTDFDRDITYKMLHKILQTLSPREQEIISMRYGLNGHKPTPFTELSVRYNLTRERVRQLEGKILRKLRTPEKLKMLDHYPDNEKKG